MGIRPGRANHFSRIDAGDARLRMRKCAFATAEGPCRIHGRPRLHAQTLHGVERDPTHHGRVSLPEHQIKDRKPQQALVQAGMGIPRIEQASREQHAGRVRERCGLVVSEIRDDPFECESCPLDRKPGLGRICDSRELAGCYRIEHAFADFARALIVIVEGHGERGEE
jgi:hypothetical protein